MLEQKQSKLDSIQALRGIAALLVLIYHIAAQQIHAPGIDPSVDSWLKLGPWNQGYAGVDLFFLISGFVMVYVTQSTGRKAKYVGAFLYKRVVRIYPLWWVFAGLLGGYFFAIHGIWASPSAPNLNAPATGYFIKSLLLLPQQNAPVLELGWSLVHEMQFYLIFAAFLFAPRRWLPPLLGIWSIVNVSGFFLGWSKTGNVQAILFSLLSLEFIVGACVAWLVLKRFELAPKAILITGVVLFLLVLVFYTDSTNIPKNWGRVILYTPPFAMIIYGASIMERAGRLSVPRWLVTLGDWSYSLYLSHYLVLIIIRRVWREASPYLPETLVGRISLGAPGVIDNVVFFVVSLMLCLIAAGMSYYIIERPLLRLARRGK